MVDNNGYIPPNATCYYARLRDSGYRVGCVGKLHLVGPSRKDHGSKGDQPILYQWGFTHPEEHEGKCEAGLSDKPTGIYTHHLAQQGKLRSFYEDYVERKRVGWASASDDAILSTEDFHDYWTGTRAVDWLNNIDSDQPWHLFVSFGGPHDPFDPPTEFADRYRNARTPDPIAANLEGKPQNIHGIYRKHEREFTDDSLAIRSRQQYAALIELIDVQVGRLMNTLEARGMLDNTIIMFTSDHGEMLGDHGLWRKRVFYESSLRVPLIAAGPGVAQGRSTDALIEMSDINPTICELAGLPAQPNIDARSFVGVLQGQTDHRESIVSQIDLRDCIRTATHKLIRTHGQLELYDLKNDPTEQVNIADQDKAMVEELNIALLQRHLSLQA